MFAHVALVYLAFLPPVASPGPEEVVEEKLPAPWVVNHPMNSGKLPPLLADFPPDLAPPVVTIKVLAPASITDNELEYRILVENRSPGAAHNVVVLSRLPANAKYLRASPEPHALQPEVTWKLNTLDGDAKCELKLVVQVTGDADVTTCVRISFEHGAIVTSRVCKSTPRTDRPQVPTPPDGQLPRPPGGERPTPPTPTLQPRLTLTLAAPRQLSFTRPIAYRLTVTNEGAGPATNVTLVDPIPARTAFANASDGGSLAGNQVQWSLGMLAPRASRTVELKLRPLAAGVVVNQAEALADGNLRTTGEARTEVIGEPGLLFEVVDTVDPVEVNGETVYVLTIKNQGSAPLTNIKVVADVPAEFVVDRVQASAEFRKEGQSISFAPLNLPANSDTVYRVFVTGKKAGDVRFRATLTADQLKAGPLVEEESTHVYDPDR